MLLKKNTPEHNILLQHMAFPPAVWPVPPIFLVSDGRKDSTSGRWIPQYFTHYPKSMAVSPCKEGVRIGNYLAPPYHRSLF